MYLSKKNIIYMEKIFINALIYTIDLKSHVYEAMGIKNGRISILGTNEEVMKFADINTEIVDLKWRCVIPSFIDCYNKLSQNALLKRVGVSLYDCKSIEEYIHKIKLYESNHEDKDLILGFGWKYERETIFNGSWINKIKTYKPIILRENSGEVLLLNSEAVKYFNINDKTTSPVGGIVEIKLDDESMEYALLKGNAINLICIENPINNIKDSYEDEICNYQHKINSYGITSISIGDKEYGQIPIEFFKKLEENNKLSTRINYRIKIMPSEICKKAVYVQTHEIKRKRILYKTELLDVPLGEIDVDGRLELGLAHLFKPYKWPELKESDYRGKFMWHMIEFVEAIKMANRLGINLLINAGGDYACKLAMDGVEYSARNNENHEYRNTINHLDLITKYYIRRMKLLNINAMVQPYWFYRRDESNFYGLSEIGEDRIHRLYPFKSLINEKIITASSSDYYVSGDPNPIKAIGCAVCRNLYEFADLGYPERISMNDFRYMLNPSEKVSVYEAIRSWTLNAAYILGMENEIGSIEIGKKADFIVLDNNIFKANPLSIENIEVIRTYLNGNLVYMK